MLQAGEEDKAAFRDAIRPFIIECAKEYGISEADLMKARETHKPDLTKPCFIGCVYKKFEFVSLYSVTLFNHMSINN